jgi:hypothetical protein
LDVLTGPRVVCIWTNSLSRQAEAKSAALPCNSSITQPRLKTCRLFQYSVSNIRVLMAVFQINN